MEIDSLTLDQLRTFVAVADGGGFSAAARAGRRSQSAVTYAIRKLEDQAGIALFDRTAYRPSLTQAGRALLPRARRVLEELFAFRAQAHGIAGGLEAELSLVVDPMFPMPAMLAAIRAFQTRFPTVRPRLYAESLGGGARLLAAGLCGIGVVSVFGLPAAGMQRVGLGRIRLAMVAAPAHPLARQAGRLPAASMRDHIQLVLTDRSGATGNRDFSVFADHTWRLGDLGTKHAMLRAGLGFGSMPEHMVADDLAAGRLVAIHPQDWEGPDATPELPMCAAWPTEAAPGPAGRWLIDTLASPQFGGKNPVESK